MPSPASPSSNQKRLTTLPAEFARTKSVDCQPAGKGPNASATYDSVHLRRWCTRPGFIDPFEVVFSCVRVLKAATFPNVQYSRKMWGTSSKETSPDKSRLSPGLALYFCPLVQDDQVIKDVQDYVQTPSQDMLRRFGRSYHLYQVLVFLLAYLRLRGALVKFRYRSLSHLQEMRNSQRWVSRAFMNTICEHQLEYEAIIQLGDYLNYVVTVAYAHDLFWIKELLADLYGPLVVDFVHIGSEAEDQLTEEELVPRRSDLMLRIIEGTPWDSLKRQQNFNLVLNTDPEGDVFRRRSHFDFEINRRLTTRPATQQMMVKTSMDIIEFFNKQLVTDACRLLPARASDDDADDKHDNDDDNHNAA